MEAGQLGVSGVSVAMKSATKSLPSTAPLERHPYSDTLTRPLNRPPLAQLTPQQVSLVAELVTVRAAPERHSPPIRSWPGIVVFLETLKIL